MLPFRLSIAPIADRTRRVERQMMPIKKGGPLLKLRIIVAGIRVFIKTSLENIQKQDVLRFVSFHVHTFICDTVLCYLIFGHRIIFGEILILVTFQYRLMHKNVVLFTVVLCLICMHFFTNSWTMFDQNSIILERMIRF